MPNAPTSQLKETLRAIPHAPGVYLMKDRLGHILYVGKAKDLKKRVSTYFQHSRRGLMQQPKVQAMLDLIADIETITVRSEAEALLLEGRLIKEKRPKYNTDFTDDKRFLLVRVDLTSELPRFRLTRNRRDDHSRYFGPFAHAGLLRQTLSQMRQKFGILLTDGRPLRLPDGRWQLYDDIRAEIYGHANVVTEEEYAARVEEASAFLEGKTREWLEKLKKEMATAADNRQFEKAAELRDIVFALRKTLSPTKRFLRGDPLKQENTAATLESLQQHLGMAVLPRTMECFDISHISGTYVVASMVHFRDGSPDRAQYRRYKIKSFVGNDDFRAMEEVVGRRYRRLHEEGKPLPDLVVIDGGRGQLGASLKAFLAQGLEPPFLIGLAKKEETVHFAEDREPVNIPHHDPALRLLQRIRDEAHEHANRYNADLRSRRIRETILDDFEGLGPVRREALLEHFGSLERLRKASPEDLQAVEGIGPKLSRKLADFLARN